MSVHNILHGCSSLQAAKKTYCTFLFWEISLAWMRTPWAFKVMKVTSICLALCPPIWHHSFITWCMSWCTRSQYRQPELLLTYVCSETETVQLQFGMLCWAWTYFGDSTAIFSCSSSRIKPLSLYYCCHLLLLFIVIMQKYKPRRVLAWWLALSLDEHTSCCLCMMMQSI